MMNIIAILLVCTTFMRESYFDLVARMPAKILPFVHTIGGGPTVPRVAVTQPPPPVHFVTYTAASAVPSSIPNNDSTFEYTCSDPYKAYLKFDEPHTENFSSPEAVTSQETIWAANPGLVLAVLLGLLVLSLEYKYRLHLSAIRSSTLRAALPLVTKTVYDQGIVHTGTESNLTDHTRVIVHDPSLTTCIQAESAESIENRHLRSRLNKLERTLHKIKTGKGKEFYRLKSEKQKLKSEKQELEDKLGMYYFRESSPLFEPRDEAQTSQQPDDQCPESVPDGEPAKQDQPKAGRLSLREKLWPVERDQRMVGLLQEDVKQLLKRIDRMNDEKSKQRKNSNRLRHRMRNVMVLSTKPKILVKVSPARKREIRRASLTHQRQIDALVAENSKLKSSEQSKDTRISKLEEMLSRKRRPAVGKKKNVAKEMLKQEIDEDERKKTPGPDTDPMPDTSAKPMEPSDTISGNASTLVTAADQEDVPDDSTAQGSCNVASQPQQASHPETQVGNTPSPLTDDRRQTDEPVDTVSGNASSQGTDADQNDLPDDSTALGPSNAASQPQQASHPEIQLGNTPLPSNDDQQQHDEPADSVSADPRSQGTGADQNGLPNDSTTLGPSNTAPQPQHTPQTGFQFGSSNTGSQGGFLFAPSGSKTIAFPEPCKKCGAYVKDNAEYCKKCTPRPVRRKCQGCPHNTALPPHTLCKPCRSHKSGRGSGAGSAGLAGGPSSIGEPSAQSGPWNASSQAGESSTPDAETSTASSKNETSAESSSAAASGGQSGSLFGRRTCKKCSGSVEGLEELCKRCASPPAKHDTSNDDKPGDGDDDDANDGSGGDRPANGSQTNSVQAIAPAQNQQEDGQPAQNPESTANEQRESTSEAQTETQPTRFSFSNTETNYWSNRTATPLSGLYAPPNPDTLLQAAGAASRSTSVFGPVASTTSFSAGTCQGSTATQDDASTRLPAKTPADTHGRCRVCNKPRQLAPGNGKCVLCHKVGSEDAEETGTNPFSAYSDHQRHIANAPGAVSTSQSQDDEEGVRLCQECKQNQAKPAHDLCEACHDEMYARK